MRDYKGIFIALEGSGGSGKATQLQLLAQRLQAAGHEVEVFDFPRFDKPSGHFVKSYLNGDYGPPDKISAYAATIFYALDRYEAASDINQSLKDGKVVLCDCYTGFSMGQQGSKFDDETEQRGFFVWEDSFEFELLGIPRPDINLYLRVPADVSLRIIESRASGSSQHAPNKKRLAKAAATYDVLCKLFPKDFVAIDCVEKNRLLAIASINNRIWDRLRDILPPPAHQGRGAVVKLDTLVSRPEAVPANQKQAEPGNKQRRDSTKVSLLLALKLLAVPGINWEISWPQSFSGNPDEYYLPDGLGKELSKQYRASMRRLGDLQQQLRKKIPDAALARLAMPMAAYAPVKLSGSKEALSSLVRDLENGNDHEQLQLANALGDGLGLAKANASSQQQDSLLRSVKDELSGTIAPRGDELTLLDYSPRVEFSLLADGLYPHTDLSRQEILDGIDLWSYERKEKALLSVLSGDNSQLFDEAKYRWDGLSGGAIILEGFQKGLVSDIKLQAPSPRFGYDMPKAIEQHGAEGEFMEAYDLSLELFSALQAAGKFNDASYTALIGHKCRWQFAVSARAVSQNLSDASSDDYSSFVSSLAEKIAEVHPIVFKALNKARRPAPTSEPPKSPAKRRRPRRRAKKTPPKDL